MFARIAVVTTAATAALLAGAGAASADEGWTPQSQITFSQDDGATFDYNAGGHSGGGSWGPGGVDLSHNWGVANS
ncbi:hypothetical protein ABZ645_25405 [Nocardiopsis alba]|uniref:hypothetical protein n=1 Tax=Nocardiopsis alba TaxID=53437 RepID=UPI0033D1DD5C